MPDSSTAPRLEKFCVKFFLADPGAVKLPEVIPLFHRWIQAGAVDGMLVDVADYSHVPDGPGVVLIGHEADYLVDGAEGPPGLLYNRKRTTDGGGNVECLRGALRSALTACRLLEREFAGQGARFEGRRLRFVVNDRLVATNDDASLAKVLPDLRKALEPLYPGQEIEFSRGSADPRSRLVVDVRSPEAVSVETLIDRL